MRHTDLKHKDKTESYGEEVKVLGEVFTVFIPETPIPAQDNNNENNNIINIFCSNQIFKIIHSK